MRIPLQLFAQFVPEPLTFGQYMYKSQALICFQVIIDPRFSILNIFKLNLEERRLACGFKCTPRY